MRSAHAEWSLTGRAEHPPRSVEGVHVDVLPASPAYVSVTSMPDGCEHPQSVATKFDAGVCAHRGASSQTVVIASRGMAMIAWMLSRCVAEAGEAAGAFWASLTSPDWLARVV